MLANSYGVIGGCVEEIIWERSNLIKQKNISELIENIIKKLQPFIKMKKFLIVIIFLNWWHTQFIKN